MEVTLTSDKNNWYFAWRCTYIYDDVLFNFYQNEKYFRL